MSKTKRKQSHTEDDGCVFDIPSGPSKKLKLTPYLKLSKKLDALLMKREVCPCSYFIVIYVSIKEINEKLKIGLKAVNKIYISIKINK